MFKNFFKPWKDIDDDRYGLNGLSDKAFVVPDDYRDTEISVEATDSTTFFALLSEINDDDGKRRLTFDMAGDELRQMNRDNLYRVTAERLEINDIYQVEKEQEGNNRMKLENIVAYTIQGDDPSEYKLLFPMTDPINEVDTFFTEGVRSGQDVTLRVKLINADQEKEIKAKITAWDNGGDDYPEAEIAIDEDENRLLSTASRIQEAIVISGFLPSENTSADGINREHYAGRTAWDTINHFNLNFNLGNVVKYTCRADQKEGIKDLKKARDYLDDEIKRQENIS